MKQPRYQASAIFDSVDAAQASVSLLLGHGVRREEIGIVSLGAKRQGEVLLEDALPYRETKKTFIGGAIGSVAGALIGGGVAVFLSNEAFLFGSATLVALVAGSALGCYAGSISGAYAELGRKDIPLEIPERMIEQEGVLVSVKTNSDNHESINSLLRRTNGRLYSLQEERGGLDSGKLEVRESEVRESEVRESEVRESNGQSTSKGHGSPSLP